MNKILILFTSTYPYDGGEQFLETEILYLSEKFEKIIIVPSKYAKKHRTVPSNVIIDNSVAVTVGKNKFLSRFLSIFSFVFISSLSFSLRKIKYTLANSLYVLHYQSWIQKYISINSLENTIFYTYWFGASTYALSLEKEKNPNIKFITRVHGGDLYEKIHKFDEFPWRKKIIKNINYIFPISNIGKQHLLYKYPNFTTRIDVSRLGVENRNKVNSRSTDSILRLLSCSSLITVKRVHLIIESLALLNNYDFEIEWTHIGDGVLRDKLELLASHKLADNIRCHFKGNIENSEIYAYYEKSTMDLFLNVSESEGIPVSIMEAHSFGIPALATNVGGNSEIVNNSNGVLLSSNPTLSEIADAIHDCFTNKKTWEEKSHLSLKSYLEKYNAHKNYNMFSDTVRCL